MIVPDTAASDLVPPEWVEIFRLKSTMTVPLIRQGEVIGVMGLDHTERATPFEPWQVDLAMAIAGQLALSLANTQLYTQVQERLRETTALLAVGRALSQPEPTDHLMRTVAREVAHAFGADMVGVYSLDAKRDALVPTAGYHVPKHLLEQFMTRSFVLARFPALAQAWREGRAAWSSDAQADPRFDCEVLEEIDAHSVLFAPTTVRGEPVGALFLVWWQTGREFGESEVRLIEGVAAQVGLGMENVELARQTELKLQETETLLSVSQTLASTLDVDALTRQFLRHVAHGSGPTARACGCWRTTGSGWRRWRATTFRRIGSRRSATCACRSGTTRSTARRPSSAAPSSPPTRPTTHASRRRSAGARRCAPTSSCRSSPRSRSSAASPPAGGTRPASSRRPSSG